MQAAYEQYRSGCQLISVLTNLQVQLFDHDRFYRSITPPMICPPCLSVINMQLWFMSFSSPL